MNILSNFSDRLNEQMLLRNINTLELANAIKVDRSTISHWKSGRYQPDTKTFFSLIVFFDCSADYMLGLIEFPPENLHYRKPVEKLGKRIRTLLKERKITQKKFQTDLSKSSNLIYQWLNDKALPTTDSLIKIANYFEITVDMLIERIK